MSLFYYLENLCVVKTSDGTLYGPFVEALDAAEWAGENEDTVGDFVVETLHKPRD